MCKEKGREREREREREMLHVRISESRPRVDPAWKALLLYVRRGGSVGENISLVSQCAAIVTKQGCQNEFLFLPLLLRPWKFSVPCVSA